mgnify:FL=1
MKKAVRLSDIAKRLDVSTVTVSNALAGQKGVSEELREKIRSTAAEMGYQTRQGPIILEKTNPVNIAVIIADKYLGSYPSFYWKVYQEFALAVKRKNCMLLYEVLKDEDEKNFVIPLSVKEKTAEGIVVIGEISSEYLKMLIEVSQMPIVFVDFSKIDIRVDSVVSDNFYGMYLMTNYLIEHGHRDIAYVGTVLANNSIKDRYCGYYKALMENHIPVREDWIIDDRAPLGKMEIDRLSLPEEMPTAFACNCDLVASELIKILAQRGYRVPEDISVVGYDNYLYTGLCDIKITTYEVNIEEMVKVSLEKILNRLKGRQPDSETIRIVSGHMVVKESVKSVN